MVAFVNLYSSESDKPDGLAEFDPANVTMAVVRGVFRKDFPPEGHEALLTGCRAGSRKG